MRQDLLREKKEAKDAGSPKKKVTGASRASKQLAGGDLGCEECGPSGMKMKIECLLAKR